MVHNIGGGWLYLQGVASTSTQKYETMAGRGHFLWAILCTAFLLASCGQATEEPGKVFRMNLPAGLSTLDPAFARDQASGWMTSQIFNGLVVLDQDLGIAPGLAHAWEVTDSGHTIVFHLRQDVQFHPDAAFAGGEGRHCSAADVSYSFMRICDPATASSGSWIFAGKVVGVDDFRAGKTDKIDGFEVRDDSTFVLHLVQPFPPMLGLLSMPYAFIVPYEAVEKYGKSFRSHPVGTGPFQFKSWQDGVNLTLLRNPHYFERVDGKQLPFLDAVRVRFIRSRLSEFVEFCQGNLDFVNGVDESVRNEVMVSGGGIKPAYAQQYQFHVAPQLNTEFLGILVDTLQPSAKGHPLSDVRVRAALAYAIDRKRLVNYVLQGNGLPGDFGIVPPGMPGFDSLAVEGFPYDPLKSELLLAFAGYPGGKGMPVISLKSNPSYNAVMEFVQKSWEHIGVVCEIDNMDGATLRELASKGEINLWRASWIADYPDAENYLSLFYSPNMPPNGPNRMRFQDAVFDSLYEAAWVAPDDSSRFALFHHMENRMMDQVPVIPLYYDKIVRMVQSDVRGLEPNAMNFLDLRKVDFNPTR